MWRCGHLTRVCKKATVITISKGNKITEYSIEKYKKELQQAPNSRIQLEVNYHIYIGSFCYIHTNSVYCTFCFVLKFLSFLFLCKLLLSKKNPILCQYEYVDKNREKWAKIKIHVLHVCHFVHLWLNAFCLCQRLVIYSTLTFEFLFDL